VIARGVPRQTVDVDATVWAAGVELDALVRVLARHGIVLRTVDALEFAQPSGTPMEVSLAWLPVERDALDRATLVDFGGVRIRGAGREDLIVYKAVAWRERDRADLERLLARHGGRIDLDRVRSLVREFADALDEPERVTAFDALVMRATAPGAEDQPPSDPTA
jgi:hypothetical protein